MKKVWIAQLKCPDNHCVVALAAEITEDQASDLEAKLWLGFHHLVENGNLNHECAICKATMLHMEVRVSQFNTLAEATPVLEESQRQQIATAQFLRSAKN